MISTHSRVREQQLLLVALAVLVALPGLVEAAERVEGRKWIAECPAFQEGPFVDLVSACIGHPGCSLVLTEYPRCDMAEGYITRLEKVLAGRKKITGDDVFEAINPPVANDAEYQAAASALRQAYLNQTGIVTKVDHAGNGVPYYYEGPIKNGKFHGIGILIVLDIKALRAQFSDGTQSGKGEFQSVFKSTRFVGDMERQKFHGNGIFHFSDGDRYAGEFAAGNKHGQGTYTWKSGGKFVGEYRNGKMFNGTATDASGKTVAVYTNGATQTSKGPPKGDGYTR